MRRMLSPIVAFIVCASTLSAQDKNWKKTLEQQLKETYTITKWDNSIWSGNATVKVPGVILVVRQAGIIGGLPDALLVRVARVQNGQLQRAEGAAGESSYLFKVGDKVYVGNINVNDENIILRLMTADAIERTIKGSTRAIRFVAVVRFEFEKGFLQTAAVTDVAKAVSPVLATEDQAAAASTKTIEIGQTIEQVEATFGKPLTIIKLADKTIYTYKDIKVTFINGKVTDVQ